MKEELEAVSYAVGLSIGGSLREQHLADIDFDLFAQGVEDILKGKSLKMDPEQAGAVIQQYMQRMMQQQFEVNKKAGEEFLADNFKKEGVITTLSGLQYEILNEGEGDSPSTSSNVTVHYEGRLLDGQIFDSSIRRGEPATFGVTQVIKGWTEALQLMKKGSKYRLYIPQELAYGPQAPGGLIQPYMALIFDVELIDFK